MIINTQKRNDIELIWCNVNLTISLIILHQGKKMSSFHTLDQQQHDEIIVQKARP